MIIVRFLNDNLLPTRPDAIFKTDDLVHFSRFLGTRFIWYETEHKTFYLHGSYTVYTIWYGSCTIRYGTYKIWYVSYTNDEVLAWYDTFLTWYVKLLIWYNTLLIRCNKFLIRLENHTRFARFLCSRSVKQDSDEKMT